MHADRLQTANEIRCKVSKGEKVTESHMKKQIMCKKDRVPTNQYSNKFTDILHNSDRDHCVKAESGQF